MFSEHIFGLSIQHAKGSNNPFIDRILMETETRAREHEPVAKLLTDYNSVAIGDARHFPFTTNASVSKDDTVITIAEPKNNIKGTQFFKSFTSVPNIMDGLGSFRPAMHGADNNFDNSLFGIISRSHNAGLDPSPPLNRYRVTISCPEKGEMARRLVLLPSSFQELLDIAAKKFGFVPAKVLTDDGAEIDDIEVVRDGDHLVIVTDSMAKEDMSLWQIVDISMIEFSIFIYLFMG